MDKNIRRLAGALSRELVFLNLHHGILILAAPFIAFVAWAADDIQPAAAAITFLIGIPILWLCTWDFVRLGVRRKYVTFNAIWMKVLPQEPPSTADGDNAPKKSSLLVPVNALFRLQLYALLFTLGVTGIATVIAGISGAPLWLALPLVPPAWYHSERRLLEKLLAKKTAGDPAFLSAVEEAAQRREKKSFREKMASAGFVLKDVTLWTWVIGPFWAFLIMMAPGLIPQPLDEGARAFYDIPPHQPKDDGFYALAGLEAPLDSADTVAFGRQRAEKAQPGDRTVFDINELLPGLDAYGHFNICTGPKPKIVPLSAGQVPPPPPPLPDPNSVPAPPVFGPVPPPPPLPPPDCLYLEEWGPILAAHKKMLDRYESLFRYEDFEGPANSEGSLHGQLLIQLSRLESIAYAYRAYAGDAEEALQAWLRNARFLKKLTATPASAASFAVYKTCYGILFRYLPYIVSRKPELAAKYKGEIGAVMLFVNPLEFDYGKVWDRDARLLPLMLERQIDVELSKASGFFETASAVSMHIMNVDVFRARLYEMTVKVHAALGQKDLAARSAALDRLLLEYEWKSDFAFTRLSDMASMIQSMMMPFLLSGIVKAVEIYDANGLTANRERTRLAWLEAMAAGVKPGEMDGFLKQAAQKDARLKDAVSGEAFYADAETQAVCFTFRLKALSHPVWVEEPRCLESARLIEREDQLKK